MNLLSEILKEHSRKQTLRLAKWVCEDRSRLKELMHLFLHGEYQVVQRSSWIVSYVSEEHPEWIKPWLKQMIEYCRARVHDAVKRNVVRIMQDVEIPKDLQGLAANLCFDFLSSPNEAVAIKVFSMTVLANIAKNEPDLKHELICLIESKMDWEKPAFKSRGRKILNELYEGRS